MDDEEASHGPIVAGGAGRRHASPSEVRKALEDLRIEAGHGRGSVWSEYGLPPWLRPLVTFEEEAVAAANFEPLLMPGLLQTEAYARAVIAGFPQMARPADIDQLVAGRMRRQRRLHDRDPMHLHAVVGEAALTYAAGGPDVLADQLRHLLDVAARPNVTLQVLPAAAAPTCGGHCSIFVLSFADPAEDPPIAYLDTALHGFVIHDVGDVAVLQVRFADVAAAALPERESAEAITGIVDRLPDPGKPP